MKDAQIFLGHILESIEAIEGHIAGVSEKDFFFDLKTQDAVIRRFEIIGEATKHIPKFVLDEFPDTEWQDIMSMRDRLIHEYFAVMMDLVWDAAKKDLPKLKKEIIGMLKKLTVNGVDSQSEDKVYR